MEQLWGLFAHLILLLLHLVISWLSGLPGRMGPRFTPSFIAACYVRVRWAETGQSGQPSEALSTQLPLPYGSSVTYRACSTRPCPTSLSSLINTMHSPLGSCCICWLRWLVPSMEEAKRSPSLHSPTKDPPSGKGNRRAGEETILPGSPTSTPYAQVPGGQHSAAQICSGRWGRGLTTALHCPCLRP